MGRLFAITVCAPVLSISLWLSGCSVPNLESRNCTAGREVVKKLYSHHFGTEMSADPHAVRYREGFLTPTLADELRSASLSSKDYFTRAEERPTAFRVGTCEDKTATTVRMQVILLWRSDASSRQAEIHVEVTEQNGNWLVNKVSE